MALEGSIRDFGLIEILQLISLQKKSGVLTVQNGDERAVISFEKGQIIYATLNRKSEGEKIGKILVYWGKLREEDLDIAIKIQEDTGERLGKILTSKGYISQDDLISALQVQVKDVVFQMLKWREGWYRFEIKRIGFHEDDVIPLSTDAVLMEGARMLDEWPEIESIIPSGDVIFSQSYQGDETGFLFSTLSPDELYVFNLVDGNRTVKEIASLTTRFSEFDVYKILSTLLLSGLITGTSILQTKEAVSSKETKKALFWNLIQGSVLSLMISLILLFIPVSEIIGIKDFSNAVSGIKKITAIKKLSSLHRAVQYYYLLNGRLPESLQVLEKDRYIEKDMLTNPQGQPFAYEVVNPYRLNGYNLD